MLKKLSINDEQREMLEELASKNLSSYKIAKKLKLSQATVWRNMRILGLAHEKTVTPPTKVKSKFFTWTKHSKNII